VTIAYNKKLKPTLTGRLQQSPYHLNHEAFTYPKATAFCTASSRFCSASLLSNNPRHFPCNICLWHNYKPSKLLKQEKQQENASQEGRQGGEDHSRSSWKQLEEWYRA